MARVPFHLRGAKPAGFSLCLLLSFHGLGCSDSATQPRDGRPGDLVANGSFEVDGEPSLDGWRVNEPSLTSLESTAPPGGGDWCLRLEADWTPTNGYVGFPVTTAEMGDVYRLSAMVRALDSSGGGAVGLVSGSLSSPHDRMSVFAASEDTAWTQVAVTDTIDAARGDTLWVVLSSLQTEVARRVGLFDVVRLELLDIRAR